MPIRGTFSLNSELPRFSLHGFKSPTVAKAEASLHPFLHQLQLQFLNYFLELHTAQALYKLHKLRRAAHQATPSSLTRAIAASEPIGCREGNAIEFQTPSFLSYNDFYLIVYPRSSLTRDVSKTLLPRSNHPTSRISSAPNQLFNLINILRTCRTEYALTSEDVLATHIHSSALGVFGRAKRTTQTHHTPHEKWA